MITDYTKQVELINACEFKDKINVIGCGATGSWVVLFLLKMGFENIHVYDFDLIEEHNIPNQAFAENHIGMPKVGAIEKMYTYLFEEAKEDKRLFIHNSRINSENAMMLRGVVFCCVDSMKARKEIYETAFKYGQASLWLEARIGLFGAYIYTLYSKSEEELSKYEDTLYDDEEVEVSICGISQTALPAAVNCASNMIMQMISKYRGNDVYSSIRWQIPDMLCFKEKWNVEKDEENEESDDLPW